MEQKIEGTLPPHVRCQLQVKKNVKGGVKQCSLNSHLL